MRGCNVFHCGFVCARLSMLGESAISGNDYRLPAQLTIRVIG